MAVKRLLKHVIESARAPFAPLAWRSRPAPRLVVLMYHRVLPPEHPDRVIEQPGMYVSPATFDLHLSLLRRYFSLVQLDDWVRQATAGEALPEQACAITFDDGWRDNFEHALPALRRHNAPATIFLVSGMTGTYQDFWPNRLARALVRLPPGGELSGMLGEMLRPAMDRVRARGSWSLAELDAAILVAKQIDEARIVESLREVEGRCGGAGDLRAVLDASEIRAMADSGLVRFGSHTRTHFRFRGAVPAEVLDSEIAGSRADIAATVGKAFAPVFCYPNGDITPEAVAAVRAHYTAAVTTQTGWHARTDDPFLIRRVGMHEDVSARSSGFLARLARGP